MKPILASPFRALGRVKRASVFALVACLAVLLAHDALAQRVTYYHNDVLGSPIVATDATGLVVWKETYRPYGQPVLNSSAAATERIGFSGKPYDRSTGLSYVGARYYDPFIGRFLSVDPKQPNEADVHSSNRYAYANNNPTRFVDPDGHSPLDIGFLVYDIAKLSLAVYRGAGVQDAAFDVAFSVVGVAIPVVGAGQALKAARIFERTSEVTHGATEVAKGANVLAFGSRGRTSEARVLKDMDLAKNTKSVATAEGRSIPDGLTSTLSVEVKDASNVFLTRQLRIQTEAARASGRESVLVTGEKTCVSGPCSRAFDTILRRPDLGPQ